MSHTESWPGEPSDVSEVEDEVMPLVTAMDGCIGLSMLADRDSGRCIVTTAWATEEAMHASAAGVQASRERAARIFGAMPEVPALIYSEEPDYAIGEKIELAGLVRTRIDLRPQPVGART